VNPLAAAAQRLADHVRSATGIEQVLPITPAAPHAWTGYVWSDDDWLQAPEDEGSFCATASVGLVVDLVAATASLANAQEWLSGRVWELWAATIAGVAVTDGDTDIIFPARTRSPSIVSVLQTGGELLVVRTEFTRFTLEVQP